MSYDPLWQQKVVQASRGYVGMPAPPPMRVRQQTPGCMFFAFHLGLIVLTGGLWLIVLIVWAIIKAVGRK